MSGGMRVGLTQQSITKAAFLEWLEFDGDNLKNWIKCYGKPVVRVQAERMNMALTMEEIERDYAATWDKRPTAEIALDLGLDRALLKKRFVAGR